MACRISHTFLGGCILCAMGTKRVNISTIRASDRPCMHTFKYRPGLTDHILKGQIQKLVYAHAQKEIDLQSEISFAS